MPYSERVRNGQMMSASEHQRAGNARQMAVPVAFQFRL
jgi:hypothetical protein